MSFIPRKIEDRTYTLCGMTFQLYSLVGFSFEDDIEIATLSDSDSGLYCFTNTYKVGHTKDSKHFVYAHTPLYLGMSFNIDDRPLNKAHEKWKHLKKDKCNCLGVFLCIEEIKEKESKLLDNYFFKENIKENEEVGGRKKTITED